MENSISRKELEKEARIKDILDTAARLFAHKDFHSVTVDEIAEQVGLSKGTIYLYFDTKENLFFSILVDRTKGLLQELNEAIQSEPDFLKCLENYIRTFFRYFERHEAYFKLMHSEKTRASLEAHIQMHQYAQEVLNDFIENICRLIQKGLDDGRLRPIPVLSMAKMLTGLLNTFTFYRIFASQNRPVEEETKMILDLFLNGTIKTDDSSGGVR
ncbi:TetR/AcrR family transcriptional regulator [bacterium]|nr:TetR/AcrR family transcriptional regulator [bacterium]